jgi:hypothetical protein
MTCSWCESHGTGLYDSGREHRDHHNVSGCPHKKAYSDQARENVHRPEIQVTGTGNTILSSNETVRMNKDAGCCTIH